MKKLALLNYHTLVAFSFSFLLFLCACKDKKKNNFAVLKLSSTPPGAKIIIDGKDISKETPVGFKISPGVHQVKFSKDNYDEAWTLLDCQRGKTTSFNMTLKPLTSSVIIVSQPEGAAVELNGKQIGETPLMLHDLPIGKHTAYIKKMNYVVRELSWEINGRRPKMVRINLESNIGILKVESKPTQANVYIDGVNRGKTPFREEIEQGAHQLLVAKDGYRQHEENLVIQRDEITNKELELDLLPGSIRVTSSPQGAEVYLNGRQYERTPTSIERLKPGKYQLLVKKGGFDQISKEVSVYPGQQSRESIILDTNLGGIDVVANPPGVTIYVDHKKVGVSEPGENETMAQVFEVRGLTSGKHVLTLAHKRATPPKKEISVTVKKGRIARPRPVTMWIADSVLKLNDGNVYHGRIRSKNEGEIIFEHQPSIAQRYGRKEIKSITPLRNEE